MKSHGFNMKMRQVACMKIMRLISATEKMDAILKINFSSQNKISKQFCRLQSIYYSESFITKSEIHIIITKSLLLFLYLLVKPTTD